MNARHIFACAALLVAAGCSNGSSDREPTPTPPPAPSPANQAKKRLEVIELRANEFEKLLNEYKTCLHRDSEEGCKDIANLLNNFSFE